MVDPTYGMTGPSPEPGRAEQSAHQGMVEPDVRNSEPPQPDGDTEAQVAEATARAISQLKALASDLE